METTTDELVLRVPARFTVIGWVVIAVTVAVTSLVAVLIWRVGPSMAFVALPLLALAPQLRTVLLNMSGNRTSHIGADGLLTQLYPWDRRRTLVPWTDVSGVWADSIGRFRYLHVGLHHPEIYVTGGRARRQVLENLLHSHGTPVLVYLPDGDDPVLDAVLEFSGGTVPELDGRPGRDEERKPAPVPWRVYRAAPRNLVLPAVLLLVAAGIGWLAWVSGLFSVGGFSIYAVLFAIGLAWRLRGRTVLDGPGFTIGRQHVPWEDVAVVRFVTTGPMRSVQVVRHRGKPLVARGLVDQPLHHPRYAARLAEVEAACTGRVETQRLWQNAVGVGILLAILPVAFAVYQLFSIDRPWEDRPWWPGVEIATETPDPCPALSTVEAGRLVPTREPQNVYGQADDPSRLCRLGNGSPKLEVKFGRTISGDLIDGSEADFDRSAGVGSFAEPVAGVGDEAVASGGGGSIVRIVARRGNVVVEVTFIPDGDGADRGTTAYAANQAAVVEVARLAVDTVDLR
jgi:hypothetical protein